MPSRMADVFTRVWSWKIDAPCLAVVVLAVWIDRYLGPGVPKEILNLLALFCIGYLLKRNLRRDVKIRHVKDALRVRKLRSGGTLVRWKEKVRTSASRGIR